MYKGKYKRTCLECRQFKAHTRMSWEYGRCKENGTFAENNFSVWGNCKEGELWVPLTVDIGIADEEANKPLWKKLLTD